MKITNVSLFFSRNPCVHLSAGSWNSPFSVVVPPNPSRPQRNPLKTLLHTKRMDYPLCPCPVSPLRVPTKGLPPDARPPWCSPSLRNRRAPPTTGMAGVPGQTSEIHTLAKRKETTCWFSHGITYTA